MKIKVAVAALIAVGAAGTVGLALVHRRRRDSLLY